MEFINTLLEVLWEDTLSRSLDMAKITGLLSTPGMRLGETMELSKSLLENAELTASVMLDLLDL